jgi:hypothetical protein
MIDLDDILRKFSALPAKEQADVTAAAFKGTAGMKFIPNPGPQTLAYESEADILLYGGEPGGGKSSLVLGLAFNKHKRSLIMRRQYTDLAGLTEDALKIHGSRDGFNGAPPPTLRIGNEQIIEFGAAKTVGDEQHWQGRPHDFFGIDEAAQFAEVQFRFLMGWLRHENPKQRCRVVLASNPPLTAEGLWIVQFFAPWLDDRHPNPAKTGELRWFVTDEEGVDKEVPGPAEVLIGGRLMKPLSRTYIPASLADNPFLARGSYKAQLDAMPEPYRSILLGKFKTTLRDQDNQCIPTAWVRAAIERWTPKPPEDVPMCAIGVDASGGGTDPMVLAPRHDGWYARPIEIPGKDIPMSSAGSFCAGLVISHRLHLAEIIVDMGGGYGGPLYEHLKANEDDPVHSRVKGFRGAESTNRRSIDGKYKFTNKRSAAYWLFREALDPGQPGGSPIALPDVPKIIADLTAPTFEVTPNGIKLEPKEHVVERIGRSTDYGDAITMAWFEGARWSDSASEWMEQGVAGRRVNRYPSVINSGRKPLSARRYS